MNSFEKATKVERKHMPVLLAYAYRRFDSVDVHSDYETQQFGDLTCDGLKVEIKIDTTPYSNLFLESWSNKSRETKGWAHKLDKYDELWYYRTRTRTLYVLVAKDLKSKVIDSGAWELYPEKMQRKYKQLNDTHGRCMPVTRVKDIMGSSMLEVTV